MVVKELRAPKNKEMAGRKVSVSSFFGHTQLFPKYLINLFLHIFTFFNMHRCLSYSVELPYELMKQSKAGFI